MQQYDDRVALSHASAHVRRGGPDWGLDLSTVNITNLLNGAQVASNVNVAATAASTNAIASWAVYVDSGVVHRQNYGNTLDANLSLTRGTHTLVVRSWNSTGVAGDHTIKVSVP